MVAVLSTTSIWYMFTACTHTLRHLQEQSKSKRILPFASLLSTAIKTTSNAGQNTKRCK